MRILTSTNLTRSLLFKTALALLAVTALWAALNLGNEWNPTTVAVNESGPTTINCPLDRANFVQLSLIPADAQVFTVCRPGGACIQVPEGLTYEIGPLRGELAGGSAIATVQTATGAATLQVDAWRVQ